MFNVKPNIEFISNKFFFLYLLNHSLLRSKIKLCFQYFVFQYRIQLVIKVPGQTVLEQLVFIADFPTQSFNEPVEQFLVLCISQV